MKLAIACAMLLASFGASASATDERGPRPASPAPASASAPATPSISDSTAPAPIAASSASPDTSAAVALAAPVSSKSDLSASTAPPEASATTTPAEPSPVNSLPNASLSPINALPAPPAAIIKLRQPPRTHSFLDSRNTFGLASLGASLTADALSTQKGLAYSGFHEMNPIARPFVQTRAGAAAYNAGSFGLMAGLMYWAHKKEHHKLERILPFAVGSWEGLLSARNYHVIANRPR